MITRKKLQAQCEKLLDLADGELSGELILEVLKSIDVSPAIIFWSLIPDELLTKEATF